MFRAVAGLLLAACLAVAPANAEIVIGVLAPLSGSYAMFGNEIAAGAAQAIADINKAGGVLGQPLKLATIDDGCDARGADAAANQLVGKNAALVVGGICFTATQAAAAVFAAHRIVQIAPATTAPKLTDERAGPGLFRLCGRDDKQGEIAGAFLARHFADKSIAVLDDKSEYGKRLADATRTAMNAAGLKETLTASYDQGQKDFAGLVAKLRAAGIDVVYLGGHADDAGVLARALKDAALDVTLVSGDALLLQDFWEKAGDAGNGAIATFPPDPRLDPANADLNRTFRKAGIEPEGYVYNAYAAIQTWAAAAKAAGKSDFDSMTAALATGTFDTVLGKVRFDAKGDAALPAFVLYQWKDGGYAPLAM